MPDWWKKFAEDPRTVCKYGKKCYQKNPDHLKKFKHPPLINKQGKASNSEESPKIERTSENSPQKLSDENTSNADLVNCNDKKDNDNEEKNSKSPIKSPSPKKRKISDSPENKTQNLSFVDSSDPKKTIKELFLVSMPEDFYSFWEFVRKESDSGNDILKKANLEAVGPFQLLMGTLPKVEETDKYLVHWRYFYDPPEFQTVLRGTGKGEFHMGYFRDAPGEDPAFVGSNDSSKNCVITPTATNLFGALYLHLEAEKKKTPFAAMSHQKIMDAVKKWAAEHKFSLDKFDTRKRLSSVAVTKSFHGAGIVAPYDKSTQLGYRPLVETDANLKKILNNLVKAETTTQKNAMLSELQPVITYATIAMDECDFGTGLELGIDLFCSGLKEFDDTIVWTLTTAYNLLNRQEFIKILETHLKYRRKDTSVLSVLNL